jgi:hypothetical protein
MLLLLQSSSADALGLHSCAHHDALPGAEQNDEHAHHHGAPSESSEPDAGCTCVGTCSVTSAAVIAVPEVFDAAPSVGTLAPARIAQALLPAPVPFLLPYGTAPPAAL